MMLARSTRLLALLGLAAVQAFAAAGFVENLTPDQRKRLGLDQLTVEQLAGLDAAVEGYRRTAEAAATQAAAASAVAEYKRTEEPAAISRAVATVKQQVAEAQQERITAVITGKFNGWTGSTLFTLDNGQVWRQSQAETYYIKSRENVPVVIYKGPGGYWRLRVLDDEGAWVTVKRVQ